MQTTLRFIVGMIVLVGSTSNLAVADQLPISNKPVPAAPPPVDAPAAPRADEVQPPATSGSECAPPPAMHTVTGTGQKYDPRYEDFDDGLGFRKAITDLDYIEIVSPVVTHRVEHHEGSSRWSFVTCKFEPTRSKSHQTIGTVQYDASGKVVRAGFEVRTKKTDFATKEQVTTYNLDDEWYTPGGQVISSHLISSQEESVAGQSILYLKDETFYDFDPVTGHWTRTTISYDKNGTVIASRKEQGPQPSA